MASTTMNNKKSSKGSIYYTQQETKPTIYLSSTKPKLKTPPPIRVIPYIEQLSYKTTPIPPKNEHQRVSENQAKKEVRTVDNFLMSLGMGSLLSDEKKQPIRENINIEAIQKYQEELELVQKKKKICKQNIHYHVHELKKAKDSLIAHMIEGKDEEYRDMFILEISDHHKQKEAAQWDYDSLDAEEDNLTETLRGIKADPSLSKSNLLLKTYKKNISKLGDLDMTQEIADIHSAKQQLNMNGSYAKSARSRPLKLPPSSSVLNKSVLDVIKKCEEEAQFIKMKQLPELEIVHHHEHDDDDDDPGQGELDETKLLEPPIAIEDDVKIL